MKPTPAEDFDATNPTNTATPLFTVAMWTDPVSYGTVERYFPASVGTCDFKLVLHLDNSAIDEISAEPVSVTGGEGFISFNTASDETVTVYNLNGTIIYTGAPGTIAVTPGLYIAKSGSHTVKVSVK
ncbi:MAG: T9SS type A sorting domain-containing protein [Duncaniella sp.]|nr:T9SS type A sorting domain-containing protein [Duncaniella sp.]